MPKLSIVIPTYNRAKQLHACLEALTQQTQPYSNFEVVVIVDGSTDETMTLLQNFDAPFHLRSIWQENTGQSGALNRGITEAKSRYCLFLDDDIVAKPQLVTVHLQAQQERQQTVAIGQITMNLPADADWYARAFAEGWQERYDTLNRGQTKLIWEECSSGNLSAPRELLLACRGFATNLPRGFDVELAYRLEKAGAVLIYLPNAVGCQDQRKGFRTLSQDAENAGSVDPILYQRDRQMLSLALASFAAGSWRKLLLRRLLLVWRIPPRLLEWFGRLLNSPARRYSWHSFIQNYCYWRGVRQAVGGTPIWSQLTTGTPILVYPAIGNSSEAALPYLMPIHRFAAHMAWIEWLGYQVISLDEFLVCQQELRLPPARSVVITFDVGNRDNYRLAFSILQKSHIPATIFLASDYVEQASQGDKDSPLVGRPLLDWSHLRELAAQGIRFGVHTSTTLSEKFVASTQAEAKINEARKRLETELGQPIDMLAHSSNECHLTVRDMAKEMGFAAGCTLIPGLNTLTTPALALRRVEMRGTDSVVHLWLALCLGENKIIRR